ncbi:MAG: NUDIX hydrolase [Rhodospirillaceae bacterium]
MIDPPESPWTTLRSQQIYDNPWIRVVEHQVLTPSKTSGIYGTIHYKHKAIGIIPIDAAGYTWLVGQYRYALRAYSWEIPEGGGDPAIPRLDSARRELEEETGLHAACWQELFQAHLSNSVGDEVATCFLAWDLTPGPSRPEETEQLEIRRLPFREAAEMVRNGTITDVMSMVTIQRLELMLLRGEAPAAVAEALSGRGRGVGQG